MRQANTPLREPPTRDLPASWKLVRVDAVGRVQLGRQRSPEFQTGRFPKQYLRAANVLDGGIETSDVYSMDFDSDAAAQFQLFPGDVLTIEGGATAGRTAVYRGQVPNACFQNSIIRFRPDVNFTCSEYAGFLFRWYYHSGYFEANSSITTIPHIGAGRFASLPFILPPLPEQRRIVEAIEVNFARLEAGVAALNRARSKLASYRESIRSAACDGTLSPPPQGVPPVPPDWVNLGSLLSSEPRSLYDGPFGSKLKTEHYASSGPRVVRLENIGDGIFVGIESHISTEHFESVRQHEVLAGDLVIAGLGTSLPRACVVPDIGRAIVKADCFRFVPDPSKASRRYLSIVLNSRPVKKWAESTVHGVGRPRLNRSDIRALRVPCPNLKWQEAIATEAEGRLSQADELLRELDSKAQGVQMLRISLLGLSFAGRLVPQDPNDEPASALLQRIKRDCSSSDSAPAVRTRRTLAAA